MEIEVDQFRVNHLPPFLLGEIAGAVAKARNSGSDIVDMSQLNPNLAPPGAAVEKLVQACLQPHNHRYSSSQGIARLREEIADYYQRRFQVSLDPNEEIVVTLGTKQGFSHLLFATLQPGDSVLLPTPAYPIHSACISLAGGHSISVPLPLCGGEVLTEKSEEVFRALEHAYESSWPRPRMLVLSFPHNPTAAVAESSFFDRVVRLAKEWGVFIIHDFAYPELAFDGFRTPSVLQTEGGSDIALEFCSFSKSLNIPGWRVGAAVGNKSLIAALKKVKSFLDCGVFQPLQIGAIKALQSADGILAENVELYQARRDVLVDGLQKLGFEVQSPKGSLFVWARLPEVARAAGSITLSRQLLEVALVAATPGEGFDSHAGEYMRFALVEPESRIRLALSRMQVLFEPR